MTSVNFIIGGTKVKLAHTVNFHKIKVELCDGQKNRKGGDYFQRNFI